MSTLRLFVSSVQRELESERLAVAELIASDSFLHKHCDAILFEHLPASTLPADRAYIQALESCDVYAGILGFEYGAPGSDGLSATHREYLHAEERHMPILMFVKGAAERDGDRDQRTIKLLDLVRHPATGHTYRRFQNYPELKQRLREALLPILAARGITPSSSEQIEFEQTVVAASDFDTQPLMRVGESDLDEGLASKYVTAVMHTPDVVPDRGTVRQTLLNRGLLWRDDGGEFRPTAAGLLLLGNAPDAVFPQSRIAANAYGGTERGEPIDRRDIRLPVPKAIEEAFAFLVRNMRHTVRVVNLSRVQVDEYPYEALREALVNAVAHRDYGLSGSGIRVEKYADRIVILSPGLPPPPVTLEKIRALRYLPCSRNPNLARGLSMFERIEEQGDGFRRMMTVTINMGLLPPEFQIVDAHFAVTFRGPGASLDKLRPQKARPVFEVEPAAAELLNEKQRAIVKRLLRDRKVEVPDLAAALKVTPQAIRKDLAALQKMGLIEKRGAARATFYVLKGDGEV